MELGINGPSFGKRIVAKDLNEIQQKIYRDCIDSTLYSDGFSRIAGALESNGFDITVKGGISDSVKMLLTKDGSAVKNKEQKAVIEYFDTGSFSKNIKDKFDSFKKNCQMILNDLPKKASLRKTSEEVEIGEGINKDAIKNLDKFFREDSEILD